MQSRLGAFFIAVFLSWNAGSVHAQGLHLIPGVPEIATDTIDDIAIATVDVPQPAIYYNPIRARRYGPQLTEFFLAHEYGHIALHHTRAGLSVLPDEVRDSALQIQELEADCFAARRSDPRARVASEAAIRFFTRLGPFRFDAVHPTGSQRAARISDCMLAVPDSPEQKVGIGETGVEVGPFSGDIERITFNVNMTALAQTERGREAQLWVDGLNVGLISNMRIPWSLRSTSSEPGYTAIGWSWLCTTRKASCSSAGRGAPGTRAHRSAGGRLLPGGLEPGIPSALKTSGP
jgi:hypothetical protein